MIQTFYFRTEAADGSFHHKVYAMSTMAAVDKWINQIGDLQSQVYSFDPRQVQNIKEQFLNGELKIYVDKEPYFLTYQHGDKHQVVHIDKLNRGEPDFIAKVTYLSTEQGGRKGYATSGYRPHVRFDGRRELTSSEQLFIDKEKVFQGETVKAEIRIIGVDFFKNFYLPDNTLKWQKHRIWLDTVKFLQ